jgi:DNA primase
MRYLRDYRGPIVVAYDNDDAGREGLERFERLRKRCCMPTFNHVFPPDGYKDWNELLMEGEQITAACASEYKLYDWSNAILSAL